MMIKLWVVGILSFALAAPGWAYLPPDLSLRRTQLVQLLPFAAVTSLQSWIDQQSVLLSPAEFLDKLRVQFPDSSVAWTFYSGWEYLNLLEHTQQAYEQREDDLSRAEELLERYDERCSSASGGQGLPLQLADAEARPVLEETEDHLRVFRVLPWPERGFSAAQVRQLQEAGRADLARVKAQRAKLEEARTNFSGHQDVWTAWLMDVAQASQKFTQAQYLKTYDDSLPTPPKGFP